MAVTSLKTAARDPAGAAPSVPGQAGRELAELPRVFTRRHPFARYLSTASLIASTAGDQQPSWSLPWRGYALRKFRFPGRDFFFFGIIGILMVPFQSVVVPCMDG